MYLASVACPIARMTDSRFDGSAPRSSRRSMYLKMPKRSCVPCKKIYPEHNVSANKYDISILSRCDAVMVSISKSTSAYGM